LFCFITQRVVVNSHRRLGTTYRSDLQGLSDVSGPPICSILMRINPKERSSHLPRGGSLKSRVICLVYRYI